MSVPAPRLADFPFTLPAASDSGPHKACLDGAARSAGMPGRTNHRVGLVLPNRYVHLWAQRHQQPTLTTPGPQNQSRPPLPQFRMQFPQSLLTRRYENGGISTVRVQNLKYLEGNCMRNLSPADERWPQGLRTHIHTLTVSALNSTSTAKLSLHAFLAISPVQNSPNSPP